MGRRLRPLKGLDFGINLARIAISPVRSLTDLGPTKTYPSADYLTWQLTEWVEILCYGAGIL